MTSLDNATQPVTDEKAQAANEPIVISADGAFGTITWKPPEDIQNRLQAFSYTAREGWELHFMCYLTAAAKALCSRFRIVENYYDYYDYIAGKDA